MASRSPWGAGAFDDAALAGHDGPRRTPKWPQPAVTAKSSPVMLRPSVVAGTAMAAISGRSWPVVTPGTGASGSSRRASSRPRAAEAARVWAACSAVGAVREPPAMPPGKGRLPNLPHRRGNGRFAKRPYQRGPMRTAQASRGAGCGALHAQQRISIQPGCSRGRAARPARGGIGPRRSGSSAPGSGRTAGDRLGRRSPGASVPRPVQRH